MKLFTDLIVKVVRAAKNDDDPNVLADSLDAIETDWPSASLLDALPLISRTRRRLAIIEDAMHSALAERLPADKTELHGKQVRRVQSVTWQWDGTEARRAVKRRILDELTLDPVTGEVHTHERRLVEQAIDRVFALTSTAPTASMNITGLRGLGLDPDEFRTRSLGKWKVTAQ